MQYLTAKQILLIHSMIIHETGGLHGVRDRNAILALEDLPGQRVFEKELYPTMFLKAAVYARGIITAHPFFDGNKRTGMTAASVFLESNGYKVLARKGEVEKLALEIIEKKFDLEHIADWFKKNSRKI